jgi:hypothetical protein
VSRDAIIEVVDGRYVIADSGRADLKSLATDLPHMGRPGISIGDGLAVIECFTRTGLVNVIYSVGLPPDPDNTVDIGEWDVVSDTVLMPMRGLPILRTASLGVPLRGRGQFTTDEDEAGVLWGVRVHAREVGLDEQPSYKIPGPLEEHYINIWYVDMV